MIPSKIKLIGLVISISIYQTLCIAQIKNIDFEISGDSFWVPDSTIKFEKKLFVSEQIGYWRGLSIKKDNIQIDFINNLIQIRGDSINYIYSIRNINLTNTNIYDSGFEITFIVDFEFYKNKTNPCEALILRDGNENQFKLIINEVKYFHKYKLRLRALIK